MSNDKSFDDKTIDQLINDINDKLSGSFTPQDLDPEAFYTIMTDTITQLETTKNVDPHMKKLFEQTEERLSAGEDRYKVLLELMVRVGTIKSIDMEGDITKLQKRLKRLETAFAQLTALILPDHLEKLIKKGS